MSDEELRISFASMIVKFNLRATNNKTSTKNQSAIRSSIKYLTPMKTSFNLASMNSQIRSKSPSKKVVPDGYRSGNQSVSGSRKNSVTVEVKSIDQLNINNSGNKGKIMNHAKNPSKEQLDAIAMAIANLNIKGMNPKLPNLPPIKSPKYED